MLEGEGDIRGREGCKEEKDILGAEGDVRARAILEEE